MKGLRDKVSPEEVRFLDTISDVDKLKYRRTKKLLRIKYGLREYRIVYLVNNLRKTVYEVLKTIK